MQISGHFYFLELKIFTKNDFYVKYHIFVYKKLRKNHALSKACGKLKTILGAKK